MYEYERLDRIERLLGKGAGLPVARISRYECREE